LRAGNPYFKGGKNPYGQGSPADQPVRTGVMKIASPRRARNSRIARRSLAKQPSQNGPANDVMENTFGGITDY
jgi:hypothetical protein